jgi:predicted solute-binding protein
MFKHVMKFLKQRENLKKPFLEHYYINFLKDLSTENLVALCKFINNKKCKIPKKNICNFR